MDDYKYVLVEDDTNILGLFLKRKGQRRNYDAGHSKVFTNGLDFTQFLKEGNRSEAYFIDDYLPNLAGETSRQFIGLSDEILRVQPDARIFYIGSSPEAEQKAYCREMGITIIRNKVEIVTSLEDILTGDR